MTDIVALYDTTPIIRPPVLHFTTACNLFFPSDAPPNDAPLLSNPVRDIRTRLVYRHHEYLGNIPAPQISTALQPPATRTHTWSFLLAAQTISSATSSATSGWIPLYTDLALSSSPLKRVTENAVRG